MTAVGDGRQQQQPIHFTDSLSSPGMERIAEIFYILELFSTAEEWSSASSASAPEAYSGFPAVNGPEQGFGPTEARGSSARVFRDGTSEPCRGLDLDDAGALYMRERFTRYSRQLGAGQKKNAPI